MFAEYVDGLRWYAEERMDECSRVTVHRNTGRTTQDEISGREVAVLDVIHADTPFRLDGNGGTRTVSVGGVEFQQATGVGHLPWDLTDLADGDLLEVTAGEWSGSVYRVVEAVKGDQKTARRVPVEEVDAGVLAG